MSTRKNKVAKKINTGLTTHKETRNKKAVSTRKTTKQRKRDVNYNVPSRDEIAHLPWRVIVAFAARCARRVISWYEAWESAEKEHIESVRRAVRLAELAGSGDRFDYQFIVDATSVAARASKVSGNILPVTYSAYAATRAGNATASAMENRHGDSDNRIATNAETVVKHCCAIADVADNSGLTSHAANVIAQAIIKDFEYLKERANSENWSEDATVSPDDFGPIWPSGHPDGWPTILSLK
jgi:hypothetical protein